MGEGSRSFRVEIRVFLGGDARMSVFAWHHISAFIRTRTIDRMKTCHRLCFPSGLWMWIEEFHRLSWTVFFSFSVTFASLCSQPHVSATCVSCCWGSVLKTPSVFQEQEIWQRKVVTQAIANLAICPNHVDSKPYLWQRAVCLTEISWNWLE